MNFQFKRHVLEIASDARTLEEKLNNLGDGMTFETMVWANGKLFVVLREYLPRAAENEATGPRSKNERDWPRKKQRSKDFGRQLPTQGQSLKK